jgi:alkanesulfonate monooxygenase SsuD/methylene tetrahydromethanopterin reductase-like flavin-dependent oxidoreductase (luciferase family)
MQFGLVLNWHTPADASAGSGIHDFDAVVEQIRLAERLGFTSVWPFKHDQIRGDVPAPWPQELMSKIAAATQTIRIGHRLSPTHGYDNSPLRAAEQAAAMDLLCGGRLEIDCSASVAQAGEPVDRDLESRCDWGTREHALQLVMKAWSQPVLGQRGTFFDLPDYAAIAKPLQRPHPPLWMSVNDAPEWALAGKLGVGVVASAPPGTALQSRLGAYRHAVCRSAPGTGAGDQIAVSTLAICSAPGGSGVSAYQAARWPPRQRPSTDEVIAGAPTRRAPRTAIDQPVPDGNRIRGGDALARAGLLIGDPERCIEAARAYAKVGVNRLLCHFPVQGAAHAAITDAMTRFAYDVIPAFA